MTRTGARSAENDGSEYVRKSESLYFSYVPGPYRSTGRGKFIASLHLTRRGGFSRHVESRTAPFFPKRLWFPNRAISPKNFDLRTARCFKKRL
jgi:hypothetical protein